jgi:hypothetical protein
LQWRPRLCAPTTRLAPNHDKQHNDDHAWSSHEDKAYRIWAKENHRKYRDFAKLNEGDQQAYWGWRHEHSDSLLKIDIR